ncbi:MAG: anti-sigma factor family protein [Sphaerochaetaceae bacterium]
MNTYLDGELTEPWKTQVEEHLRYCTACQSRSQQLSSLHHVVSQSRLEDDEIEKRQDRVLEFMEKNYLSKGGKVGFFHRDFKIKTPTLLVAAAAFVVFFVGALILGPGTKMTENDLIPSVVVPSEGQVVQVRSTEALAASQVLENFTLEEILMYLDSRGYEVDLSLKGIKPVGEQPIE